LGTAVTVLSRQLLKILLRDQKIQGEEDGLSMQLRSDWVEEEAKFAGGTLNPQALSKME
jgi:Arc/MetJ family transcription regulator